MENSRLMDVVLQWVNKADRDIEIAMRDKTNIEPLTDVICFHCQQAVEKYLKAFLVSHGIKPPKVHIIEELIVECERVDTSFGILRPVMYMSEYAVELRYPDDFFLPPIEQMEKAVSDAVMVKTFIRSRLKI